MAGIQMSPEFCHLCLWVGGGPMVENKGNSAYASQASPSMKLVSSFQVYTTLCSVASLACYAASVCLPCCPNGVIKQDVIGIYIQMIGRSGAA